MKLGPCLSITAAALLAAVSLGAAQPSSARLTLVPLESEPAEGGATVDADALAALRQKVADEPKNREARFALVRALISARQLAEALAAAREWRAADAYNLVVVRLLGDIYTALGEDEQALRTYSAVAELLPENPSAQRALASVLKQSGKLAAARDRLAAAAALRPDDVRTAFELADVAYRLGDLKDARARLEAIAHNPEAPAAVSYPAKQRLAQIYAEQRRAARGRGDTAAATALDGAIAALAIEGGVENDIKIYLTWDTDRSDVDLWVTNPAGEKVFYQHKQGKFGEALYNDVTTGYGPESFTAPRAQPGAYEVQVNYYSGGRSNFPEARGEVVVVLDEGRASEQKHVLPYRLFAKGQTVTVARIEVKP